MSLSSLTGSISQFASTFVAPVANLVARIYIGMEFFRSGLTKLDDWEETVDMFTEEWVVPLLPPQLSALLGTAGELILPVMLILGIFTRIGAAGLFIMALVIELFIYPGTNQHYYWMIILGLLVGYGGDKISVDNLLFRKRS